MIAAFAGHVVNRECATKVDRRMLYAVGAAIVAAVSALAGSAHAPSIAIICASCVAIVEIDARLRIIPNPLVLLILIAALLMGGDMAPRLAGAVLLGGLFLLVRAAYARAHQGAEGLGLGDVKLAFALGAVLGLQHGLQAVALAAIITCCWILTRNALRAEGDRTAPFGVALAGVTAAFVATGLAA